MNNGNDCYDALWTFLLAVSEKMYITIYTYTHICGFFLLVLVFNMIYNKFIMIIFDGKDYANSQDRFLHV